MRLVAADSQNDLAVLRRDVPVTEVATFREGPRLRPGDTVIAIGFPLTDLLASGAKLTTGIVRAMRGLGDNPARLQISAPVQPGNSGGPLLDASGHVVGVITGVLDPAIAAAGTGLSPQNVNFAVHGAVARRFLEAKGVVHATAISGRAMEVADIGDKTAKFTVLVECWK